MICEDCDQTYDEDQGRYYHIGGYWLCDDCFDQKTE